MRHQGRWIRHVGGPTQAEGKADVVGGGGYYRMQTSPTPSQWFKHHHIVRYQRRRSFPVQAAPTTTTYTDATIPPQQSLYLRGRQTRALQLEPVQSMGNLRIFTTRSDLQADPPPPICNRAGSKWGEDDRRWKITDTYK